MITACGSPADEPDKFPSEVYRGRRILFCEEVCRIAFLRNPEGFLSGDVEHTADPS
jgi:YHS domain-containing protein